MSLVTAIAVCSLVLAPRPALHRSPATTCARAGACVCSADDASFDTAMKMKVSELKAELDMRKISYDGLFEKEEYARLLAESRSAGRADPSLIDDFNKASVEQAWAADGAAPDVDAAEAIASDGGLPGGMSPEMLQQLTQNPELMQLLRNPKMQDVMRTVMAGGPEAAAASMDDPEIREMLQKVQALTGNAKKPPA